MVTLLYLLLIITRYRYCDDKGMAPKETLLSLWRLHSGTFRKLVLILHSKRLNVRLTELPEERPAKVSLCLSSPKRRNHTFAKKRFFVAFIHYFLKPVIFSPVPFSPKY
jgi:hypothetical protein